MTGPDTTSPRVKHRAEILAERLSLARLADQRDSPDAARWWQEVADALVRLHEAVARDAGKRGAA